jgi:hypothetical protein
VRLFDVLLGRSKPVEANLDRLFGLPGAQVTLEASAGLRPSGEAGVCFKPAAGQPFAATATEIEQLLGLDKEVAHLHDENDSFGYRWIVLRSEDFEGLVNQVHLVNTTLKEHGYGPQLLCSVFGFEPIPGGAADPSSGTGAMPAQGVYLVYLYKRGSFYPFVPLGDERRDNEAELRLKALLANDLMIEPDLERWFPLWGLPVH